MSKTERDLSSDGGVDALDELFRDEAYDAAFDDALEQAELEITDRETDDESTRDAAVQVDDEPDDGDDTDAVVADTIDADTIDDVDDVDDGDDPETGVESDAVQELHEVGDVDEPEADLEDRTIDGADLDEPEADHDEDDAEADDYVLPEIIPATSDTEARTTVGDPDLDDDLDADDDVEDVSEDILEELRRADIDGPVVPHAPQDDTTTAVRRPRRAADYDPAPVPIPAKVPRVLGRKPRVRKVTRVVRHVDPWSVFKIALVAHLVLYVIVLTASVLLWNVANATGTVDNVERFFESFGWNSFEFNGGELYHAGWIAGLFVVIGLTGLAVLAATLFNLITDLVGGVRFTVLEEEVLETRTSPMRRFVVRRPEPEVPALLHDSSGAMYREAVVDDTGANHRPTR